MGDLYLIPDREHIAESMELSEQYHACFEYNDFFLPDILEDGDRVRKIIGFYKSLHRDMSRDMMHGAFLDLVVHSEDRRIREISELRMRQSMEIAAGMNLRGVVFHGNAIPNFQTDSYLARWLEYNEAFLRRLLREYPGQDIYFENMFDQEPELLVRLAERMRDEERFGICYDYAHACVFGHGIEEWTRKLAPYTKHMHINDNDLKVDLHQSVGSGLIDWHHYVKCIQDAGITGSVLVEVKSLDSQRKSLEYMQKNDIYPFAMPAVSA